MYESAQQYRIALDREIRNALEIVPHDAMFKTQLYKSICSIPHTLTSEVAERIRQETFELVNKRLNQIK